MQIRSFVLGILLAFLVGCSESNFHADSENQVQSIIGGTELRDGDLAARYVVMVVDEPTGKTCTGTLISNSLILTAAHCMGSAKNKLTLAFGLNPLSGKYQLRKSKSIRIHPQYRKSNKDNRFDIALISIEGTLPSGYVPAQMASASFPLKANAEFTALGYGRISGHKPSPEDSTQGIGRLRRVNLRVFELNKDETQFSVLQNRQLGICSGDSGGPAFIHYKGQNYVVGVASAVTWTSPSGLSGAALQRYLAKKDYCSEKSIYMNVQKFSGWIQSSSKELMN